MNPGINGRSLLPPAPSSAQKAGKFFGSLAVALAVVAFGGVVVAALTFVLHTYIPAVPVPTWWDAVSMWCCVVLLRLLWPRRAADTK